MAFTTKAIAFEFENLFSMELSSHVADSKATARIIIALITKGRYEIIAAPTNCRISSSNILIASTINNRMRIYFTISPMALDRENSFSLILSSGTIFFTTESVPPLTGFP